MSIAEDTIAIQQLAARYALAGDSRDVDLMVSLFVDDVRVGKGLTGKAAFHEFWSKRWATFGRSMHYISNHVVDLGTDGDPDKATGGVYCCELQESSADGSWSVYCFRYFDQYKRTSQGWRFVRREPIVWFRSDGLKIAETPGAQWSGLPGAFPTWAPFWAAAKSAQTS